MQEYSRDVKKYAKADYEPLLSFTLDRLRDRTSATVLEIGSGPGWIGIMLAQRHGGIKVTGVDVSSEYVAIANRNAARESVSDRVATRLGDARELSQFADRSFGAVISNQSLHYWQPPKLVFDEISRVLKPGGAFCIGDDRRDLTLVARLTVSIGKWILSRAVRKSWIDSINGCYTAEEVANLMEDSALRGQWELLIKSRMMYIIGSTIPSPPESPQADLVS